MLFLEMQRQYPDRFYLLQYEDLAARTSEKVEELFRFTGLEMTSQTKNFLTDSKTKKVDDDYSVFRGNKDLSGWKNELDPKIIDRVQRELAGTPLEVFLKEK